LSWRLYTIAYSDGIGNSDGHTDADSDTNTV
jgi:hypothetical protein